MPLFMFYFQIKGIEYLSKKNLSRGVGHTYTPELEVIKILGLLDIN